MCAGVKFAIGIDSVFFFLMIRRPPGSTQSRSSAASDVYKRQAMTGSRVSDAAATAALSMIRLITMSATAGVGSSLSLIHISEPTRTY